VLSERGGEVAIQSCIADPSVKQLGELGKLSGSLVVSANLSDIASMIALAARVARASDACEPTTRGTLGRETC
jgi:hypothetical protein